MIDWTAFFVVAGASLVSAALIVSLYSLGLRLLTSAGRSPVVDPAEFTGAITVLTPKRAAKEARRSRKAAAANPLTAGQKRAALIGAYAC
ncbi:MAG TPA: peptidase, partial [Cryobacterium sp.]|nr:peptidase [Cryobacterium sp.]